MEDIYTPSEDTFLILRHIKEYARDKSVLDMGTGSGILAIEALRYASRVVAADSNPKALEHVAQKAKEIELIETDLFSNIADSFDLIIFNPPYLPEDEYGSKATDGGKEGYETILRFLREARGHLNTNGIILLVFSSHSGKLRIDTAIQELGYTFKELERKSLFFETLYLYEIG